MKHSISRLWALALLAMGMVLLPSVAQAAGGHQLTVKAKPTIAGTFNKSSVELVAGETIHLYAYANANFTFVQWTDETGEVVSRQMDFTYTMPDHDVQLTAVYEYNPANPGNPARNYWNKELGEVIVDDFTTGSLANAVNAIISGSQASEVQMITVAGVMNNNDFGIVNNYTNCTLLDLSRVAGVTAVPSYAFDYTNLESVYLPATIENIGYRAFYNCQQLSSLIVYAMTPPTLESNVFTGVPDGLVVYVPAAAIAQYQEAAGWKNFTMLPIQEDIRSISVLLPDGANAQDYAKMWLELTNTKSGQRMHYIMTDRSQYTFANIIRNTSWNVVLRNERGDIFGQIDNVEVKDEDVSVTFASLSRPQSVSLSVLTPDGTNVTEQVQVTWTDAQGNYVAQGVSLAGLPVGYRVNYRLTLSQELAMQYDTLTAAEYTLKDGGNALTCQLQAIKQLQLSGKVKDASTGMPLSGAVISASQTFGGKYTRTLNAKTDGNGMFTMEVASVPTSVAFAATDYISQTIEFLNHEFDELNEFVVPEVSLKSIMGATIKVGYTYTTVEGETQNWYSDYQNVGYTLFNITKNQPISQFNVQYPQIVLLEDVDDGDVLRLTATSRTTNYTNGTNVGAFMPVTTTATIVEQRAEATFAITELGAIRASFAQTGNASVVGSLYDAAGKLVKTYDYANASLTISGLADGSYTLVTMGSSRLFNTIYDLEQLPQTGLAEGTDYIKNTVAVQSGSISQINIAEVPTLDESKLYYTGGNTSFTVNKPSIVAGNYLTLTGHIDFKPAYATNVSNVQMIVDLPESCQFVENSVMVGNSTSSYTLNGNRITIPMARYTDRVRFCIIPTLGGDYAPSAFAQFDIDGETITQPIGSANYTAKDLSISVPSTVAKTAVPISGTAIGASNVEIYDNGVLIGQMTSLANGTWTTTCELNEPYNLSIHSINAKVTTKQGIELQSEIVDCMYDKNCIETKTVTMSFYNGWLKRNVEVVFDLENKMVSSSSYMFYTGTDITFVANLSNNDTTLVNDVMIRVYTDKKEWKNLKAFYDKNQDRWVAIEKFQSNNLPIGVKVEIKTNTVPLADTHKSQNDYDALDDFINNFLLDNKRIEEHDKILSAELKKDNIDFNKIKELFGEYYGIDFADVYDNELLALDDEAFEHYLENIFVETDEIGEDIYDEMLKVVSEHQRYGQSEQILQDGVVLRRTIKKCDELLPDEMLSQGFHEVPATNGIILERVTDDFYEIADFTSNIYIKYEILHEKSTSRAKSNEDLWNVIVERIKDAIANLLSDKDKITQLYSKFNADRMFRLDKINNLEKSYQKSLERLNKKLENGIIGLNTLKLEGQRQELLEKMKKLEKKKEKMMKLPRSVAKINKVIFELEKAYKLFNELITYHKRIDALKIPDCVRNANPEFAAILDGMIQNIKNDFLGYAVWKVSLYAVSKVGDVTLAKIPLLPDLLNLLEEAAESIRDDQFARYTGNEIDMVKKNINSGRKKYCKNDDENDNDGDNNNDDKRDDEPQPTSSPIHDPSGYVYEGVSNNRIQGVTSTIFYKEMVEDMYGDLHENIVKWDAAEYAQENPLFTDENGYYRWDVPQGLWQVKFEKEGYETTYSEWLPVPPPQLDINIAMKQNVQPNVKQVRAYEDAVEMEFDKYMMPELLTTDNIIVMQGDQPVAGTIELVNEEAATEGSEETFASKVRFNAEQPFTEQEITLTVSNRVKSYAGIRMQDDFQQSFAIEQEIREIVCDSAMAVGYGETEEVVVEVKPAAAAVGKTLTVTSSSPMILSTELESIILGDDGKATLTVNGELPGMAALTFAIDGYELSATTIVNVEASTVTAIPLANIASGTKVETGTEITLTCKTQGATIYYTTDGSCPCNEETRQVYDGTPIVIRKNTIIRTMAVAPGKEDSDVAQYTYVVMPGDVNGDNLVDSGDVMAVYQVMAGNASADMQAWADVNGDNSVDSGDIMAIYRIMEDS